MWANFDLQVRQLAGWGQRIGDDSSELVSWKRTKQGK